MPENISELTARRAATIAKPGRHTAGNNVYRNAQPTDTGERLEFWVLRYVSPLGRARASRTHSAMTPPPWRVVLLQDAAAGVMSHCEDAETTPLRRD